jgi:enediyne biosynthesis protein E4
MALLSRSLYAGTVLVLLTLAACGPDEEETVTDGSTSDTSDAGEDASDGSGNALPDAVCHSGSAWAPGTEMFVEVTEDWNLDGVNGVRLNAADIDGDGWVDLLVRQGGTRIEPLGPDTPKTIHLLRNLQGQGFEDVTLSSGILDWRYLDDVDLGRPMDVVAFGDVDNDGDLDVFSGISTVDNTLTGNERSEVLLNDGNGVFFLTSVDNPIRRPEEVDAVAGASFVDYNRDGLLDLWVAHHNYEDPANGTTFAQDRLFRGTGDGTFVDVTAEAGLTTQDWDDILVINAAGAHSRAWSAAACDLNNDGITELLAASYGRAPNHLWQGVLGDDAVVFQNQSVASGYAYDDNRTWENNQFAMCYCQNNPEADGCDAAGRPAITCNSPNWQHSTDREAFRLGGNSGTTVCADIDGDGWFDLVTTEIRHWWAGDGSDGSSILFNTGEADVRFERPSREETGMIVDHVTQGGWDEGHMTATVFDADNDGRMDIYLGGSDYAGNRGLLYMQVAEREFEPVSVDDFFEHNRSHGVTAADFDRDGDLDIVVGHSRARCDASAPNNCYETGNVRFFENRMGTESNWLQIQLIGTGNSNRSAVGARIQLQAGDLGQTRQVQAGYGHYGAQDDMVQHFGLGTACEATVRVVWPDGLGTTEEFTLPSGHRFVIEQGFGVRVAE